MSKYNGEIVAGSLLVKESRIIADLLLRGLEEEILSGSIGLERPSETKPSKCQATSQAHTEQVAAPS